MPRNSTTPSRTRTKPPKWTGRDLNAEARIQAAVVAYIRLVAPQCLVAAVGNGGQKNHSRAKWMGEVAGFTDLIIIDEHGLAYFMEVKTVDGVLSSAQKDFRDMCRKIHFPWCLVRNVNDVADALAQFGIRTREVKR